MKQKLLSIIDENKDNIFQFADTLFMHPELGFKEFETKRTIVDELAKHGIQVEKEYFETGFEVSLHRGDGPVIGLISELDAIKTMGHPFANKETQAAHSCGHSLQVAIMCGVVEAINKAHVLDELPGTIKLFFTPAEEFCDLEYRKELIKQGKIQAYSGKENMLLSHAFDDCDVLLSVHVMGESEYDYSVHSKLAGFCYKKIHFIGKAAHAAVIPSQGVNALNCFTLFQSAMGMLRETFVDEDKVRIHGIVTQGGETVNSIPAKVTYECYIRSVNGETIQNLSKQIDITALSCAKALNGDVEIEDLPGYFPLIQSKEVNTIVHDEIKEICPNAKIKYNEISMAAGDIGDISLFKPVIQLGFGGTKGRVHGTTFEIYDYEKAYIEPIKIISATIYELLKNKEKTKEIASTYKQHMTLEEYQDYLKRQ